MLETNITLINKLGLHARASAKFVSTASKYISSIEIIGNGKTINGKSIMGVIMLAASVNTPLTLKINGADEKEMTEALTTLINNKFGEEE